MLVFSCFIVRTISSMVAAVSVTLAAWVSTCCFTPSIFALISFTAPAVSIILVDNSFPISSISLLFLPTACIEAPILVIVSLKYSDKSVTSSLPITGSRTVKSPSPCAIFFKALTAVCTGFTIVRAIIYTITIATSKMISPIITIVPRKVLTVPINSSAGALTSTVHPVVFITAYAAIFRTLSYS